MLADMIRAAPDQWIYVQHYISCQVKRCKLKRREEITSSKKKEEEAGPEEVGGGGGAQSEGAAGAADPIPDSCGAGGCGEKGESWSDLGSVENRLAIKQFCRLLLCWLSRL